MSDSKHFDEIDENALGEVSGAGADEQRKKILEIIGSEPYIGAHLMYGVTPKDFSPPKKDKKDDGKPEKIDENALGEVSGAGADEQRKKILEIVGSAPKSIIEPQVAYGTPRFRPKISADPSKPPLDKDSKDKDKKENAGESEENKN